MLLPLVWTAWLPASAMAEESVQPGCLTAVGVYQLTDFDPKLTGRTVRVAMVELSQSTMFDNELSDYAFMPNFEHRSLTHVNLGDLYCYQNPHHPIVCSDHATMIAGTLFGRDTSAGLADLGAFEYRGIVPDALVEVFETNWFIYKQVLAGVRESFDNDVISISWGTDASDAITAWWQRGIDAMAQHQGVVIAAGCGNGSDDEFTSISKPSWGYNVISVGAASGLGDFPDFLQYIGPPIMTCSSFGPTDDGRCKPDIIAPGICLGPSGYSDETYNCEMTAVSYSSFAAPQIAGIAALLIDAIRQNDIAHADDPRVIKALLLNGANKLIGWHKGNCGPRDDHEVPLDYQQGAGLVNAWNSYRHLIAGRYDPNDLSGPGDPNDANHGWDWGWVNFDPNDPDSKRTYYMPEPLEPHSYFKATLCWYRHYQPQGVFEPLPLNVLTLELWSVDQQGNLSAKLDYSDSTCDNLQHIYYYSPQAQSVAMIVNGIGSGVGDISWEPYGLAYCSGQDNWSGDLFSADLDADGLVGVNDLLQLIDKILWTQNNNHPIEEYLREDINADGQINGLDLSKLAEQWQWRSIWN